MTDDWRPEEVRRKDEFIEEHFRYEVGMMRWTKDTLVAGVRDSNCGNALIESFCVHARNLIEFFKGRGEFKPAEFTKPGYTRDTRFINNSALQQITQQVSHLTGKRTKNASEKIKTTEMPDIAAAIDAQVDRFVAALTDEYAAKLRAADAKPSPALLDTSATTTSATNSIIMMTTKPTNQPRE